MPWPFMGTVSAALALGLGLAAPAWAQQASDGIPAVPEAPPPVPAAPPEAAGDGDPIEAAADGVEQLDAELEELAAKVEARIQAMTRAATAQEESLRFLRSQVEQAMDSLTHQRDRSERFRQEKVELSAGMDDLAKTRSELEIQLARLTTERDDALASLEDQVSELAGLLALEKETSTGLSAQLAGLTTELDAAGRRNKTLAEELAEARRTMALREETIAAQLQQLEILKSLRDELTGQLTAVQAALVAREQAVAALEARLAETDKQAETLASKLGTNEEAVAAQLEELAVLKSLRDELSQQLTAAEAALAAREAEARDLEARLAESDKQGRILTLQLDTAQQIADAQGELNEESQRKIDLLNRQILSLREQMNRLTDALEVSDTKTRKQELQISDLGRKLKLALSSKLQELARYRSEFFGRLRRVLGDQPGVRVVGDRFVFQSEVLFASGSAELGRDGRAQLAQLAKTLADISAEFPEDIDWVLRIDGHTDRRPIRTFEFASNWELSTARAISVVKFLISRGIPAERLAATGFGEFRPLDGGDDEIAFRRNRRIEIKLTQH